MSRKWCDHFPRRLRSFPAPLLRPTITSRADWRRKFATCVLSISTVGVRACGGLRALSVSVCVCLRARPPPPAPCQPSHALRPWQPTDTARRETWYAVERGTPCHRSTTPRARGTPWNVPPVSRKTVNLCARTLSVSVVLPLFPGCAVHARLAPTRRCAVDPRQSAARPPLGA
jgi:hypothetical protein